MADDGSIRVAVLYSPAAREVREWHLSLPAGATVVQALRACDAGALLEDAQLGRWPVGVWGRKTPLDRVLRQGDRVEIYRPLRIDPKLARRERFRQQGVRAAGLFARK